MSVTSSQLLNSVKQDIVEVTADEVQKQLGAGDKIHIIDVRERDEVMDGYISGAALIPLSLIHI